MRHARLIRLLAALLAGSAACSEPAAPTPAPDAAMAKDSIPADAKVVNNWVQGYSANLRFHGGIPDGQDVHLERDLHGTKTILSFGNTHLTPPALSFAVDDSVSVVLPGKPASPLQFTLRFGFIAESSAQPLQCGKSGTYPFSCQSPAMLVTYKGFSYRSTCPGLQGAIVVTDWSQDPGGRFAGHFSGRLQAYKPDSQKLDDCAAANTKETCSKTDWWVDVDGVFGFELPAVNGTEAP